MVNSIEAPHFLHCLAHRIGHLVQRHVGGTDHVPAEQLPADELIPLLPIIVPRIVDAHDRKHVALAGLHQGQNLKPLIMRAEPAGKEHDGIRFLHKQKLAREEVFEMHQLLIAGDDGVG